jgi:hypothetical protein
MIIWKRADANVGSITWELPRTIEVRIAELDLDLQALIEDDAMQLVEQFLLVTWGVLLSGHPRHIDDLAAVLAKFSEDKIRELRAARQPEGR